MEKKQKRNNFCFDSTTESQINLFSNLLRKSKASRETESFHVRPVKRAEENKQPKVGVVSL